jgi:hypothetical protein
MDVRMSGFKINAIDLKNYLFPRFAWLAYPGGDQNGASCNIVDPDIARLRLCAAIAGAATRDYWRR